MNGNVRPAAMARIDTQKLAEQFINEQITALRQQIGDGRVLLALSGGVDKVSRDIALRVGADGSRGVRGGNYFLAHG